MERRYADQSPAWLIPRLAAIQNIRGLWDEAAKKRADDHALQMKLLGGESSLGEGDDMPGDITIQGDTYNITQAPKEEPIKVELPKPPISPPAVIAAARFTHPLWSMAAGSLLTLAGTALGWYIHPPSQPAAPPPAAVDTDTITEIRFPN